MVVYCRGGKVFRVACSSVACVHEVIDINNDDVTITASSTIDGRQPIDVLSGGNKWSPSPDWPDIIHNVSIKINTDENKAEITDVTFNVYGVTQVDVILLIDGAIVNTAGNLYITEGADVVSVNFPQYVADEIVLRVTEDLNADSVTVGGLSALACYHPYVSSTISTTLTFTSITGVSGFTTPIVVSSTGATLTPSPVSSTGQNEWSEWSPWSPCDVTCGNSVSIRVRTCNGSVTCPGSFQETKQCVEENCLTTPNWTVWTPWSACDVLCGEGVRTRYRLCNDPPPLPGQTGCVGPNEEELVCTEPPCQCSFYMESFSTVFGYQPGEVIGWMEKDGVPGPTSEEELVRLEDDVGDDATIHVECNNCTCSSGSFACSNDTCQNCTYTPWTDWTDCSKTCDVGHRLRSRSLLTLVDPHMCTNDRTEVEDCNTELCPNTWSTWSPWSDCSNTTPCKVGVTSRTRDCETTSCVGDPMEIEPCGPVNDACDETDCTNNKVWAECAECPTTCEDYRLSTYCSPSEACQPGCQCPDGYVTSSNGECVQQDSCPCFTDDGVPVWPNMPYTPVNEPCKTCMCDSTSNNTHTCTIDPECCDWEEWTSWGGCSVDCGDGTKTRYRTQLNGVNCGVSEETEDCNEGECPPTCIIDGNEYGFGEVISDDFCETCHCTYEGIKYCSNDTLNIIDGIWSAWSSWGQCSSSCTGGSMTRTRTCSDPLPACGGNTCPGNNTEHEDCNVDINCCEVTPYDQWSECDQACGPGVETRTRTYVDPSASAECDTQLEDTHACNYGDCNATCVVSEWEEWTACSATCGQGQMSRSRDITVPSVECNTMLIDYQDCYNGDCPCLDNKVWSNNSLCQQTCDDRNGYFNAAVCDVISGGCVCADGEYTDVKGDCVTDDICDKCYVNGTLVDDGSIYDKLEDACYTCECVDGYETCSRKCQIPTCANNEELSYDVPNACCPICVPVLDTCQLYTTTEILEDAASGCVSVDLVTMNYCAGRCGNSTSSSRLMLTPEDSTLDSDCNCCTGITGEIKEVAVECGANKIARTAYIAMIDQCICHNACTEGPAKKR